MLQTADLTLRPWRPSDAAALAPACGDADICRFTTVPPEFTPEGARTWIADQQARNGRGEALVLAIVPKALGSPVGMVGLFGLTDGSGPRLGYWLIREHRRRGLASGAARVLTD